MEILRKIFLSAVCILTAAGVAAQDTRLAEMKAGYGNGNRRTAFLREYVEALRNAPDAECRAAVLSDYMMGLWPAKRYTPANIADFIAFGVGPGEEVFADAAANWSGIRAGAEIKAELAAAMNDSLIGTIYNYLTMKGVPGTTVSKPDFSPLSKSSDAPGEPFLHETLSWMRLWNSWVADDTATMAAVMEELLRDDNAAAEWRRQAIRALFLGILLEKTDMEQTRALLSALELRCAAEGKRVSSLTQTKDNFTGKLMLMEMGLE